MTPPPIVLQSDPVCGVDNGFFLLRAENDPAYAKGDDGEIGGIQEFMVGGYFRVTNTPWIHSNGYYVPNRDSPFRNAICFFFFHFFPKYSSHVFKSPKIYSLQAPFPLPLI